MMMDIDSGKIGTVLVKDMSRVGRDYLQTGFYTEIYFKEKDVRFIAIDSHVDNSCSDGLEFAPMLNVLNEMYLHDLSKKVNIGFRAKGMSGQSLTSTPLFGYKRDPEDKNHWVIEPETAEIVRRIFELVATGMNPHRIAKILQTERRITPSTYFRRSDMGNRYHTRRQETGDYDWHSAKALRPLLKETIQTVSRYALTNQEEFLARLQREMLAEQPEQTKQLKKGIAAKNKRVAELDRLLKKLYENYALEKIPEERFDALSAEYESEQTQLEKAVLEEQRQLDEIQSGEDKIERFMALVERYHGLERAQVRRNLAAGLGGCTKRGAQSSGTDGAR